jgi:hypothetical protein
MELMRPRLAIESADRMKLDANSGQNSDEAGVVLASDVIDTGFVRRKYCVMPILKMVQISIPGL